MKNIIFRQNHVRMGLKPIEVIRPFFSKEELEILAKESGFVKRIGKISGSIFLGDEGRL